MAEAFAILGVVQAALSLVSYGGKIVKRMDEFNHNVKGLPESFVKIRNQLPLLLNILENLEANQGELSSETQSLLKPVSDGLRKDSELRRDPSECLAIPKRFEQRKDRQGL